MENSNFRPLQNRHPSTNHEKKFVTSDYVGDPTAVLNWCTSVHGGLVGEWVKHNLFFYLFMPCSGTHLQVRPVDGFSRTIAETTRTPAGMCLFGFVDMAPHLGGQIPQKPNLL